LNGLGKQASDGYCTVAIGNVAFAGFGGGGGFSPFDRLAFSI
jgi:hypothetical protein